MLGLFDDVERELTSSVRANFKSYVFEERCDIEQCEKEIVLAKSPGELFDNLITFYEESGDSDNRRKNIAKDAWDKLDETMEKMITSLNALPAKLKKAKHDEIDFPKNAGELSGIVSSLASTIRSTASGTNKDNPHITEAVCAAKTTLKRVKKLSDASCKYIAPEASRVISKLSSSISQLKGACSTMATLELASLDGKTPKRSSDFGVLRSTITSVLRAIA